MIRCTKSKVNIKSSTYNQTGQNYFEQLKACNLMSWHLRRILLAKNVVDTKNKDYLLKKSRQREVQKVCHERIYLHPDVIDDVIDRLAYDTQRHPMDILKMDINPKRLNCCNCNLNFRQRDSRQRSSSKSRKTSPTTACSPKHKKFISETNSRQDFKCIRDIPPIIDPSTILLQKSESQSQIQETSDHHSVLSSTSRSYDGPVCDNNPFEQFASKRLPCQKEEDKKYIKFIYDITKDIMQNGLYTDKELQGVFKKHIDQNKRILNMNRMLYEIYQLKISLNIADDSEEDEELDDLIHAQKLLSIYEIRPPTPPKVLNENKVMEKLESYQKIIDLEKRLNCTKKSVTLVDANHELLVTEEDVLLSLMEGGIDPKQAQHICRNLLYRSRDAVNETIQVDAETCSTDVKDNPDNPEELRNNNRQTFEVETQTSEIGIHDSVANNSTNSFVKQETNSSISDLISTQTETIETKEDTKSETQTKSMSEDNEIES